MLELKKTIIFMGWALVAPIMALTLHFIWCIAVQLRKQKGGVIRTIRHLTLWCVVLTGLFIYSYQNYMKVTSNYTNLHREVSSLKVSYDEHFRLFHSVYNGD